MKRKFSKEQKKEEELLGAIIFRLDEPISQCPLCKKYKGFCGSGDCHKCPANKPWKYEKNYCDHFIDKREEVKDLLREMLRSVRGEK